MGIESDILSDWHASAAALQWLQELGALDPVGEMPVDRYALAEHRLITVPLLKPTTLYLMVIYTIAGFQIFERVYIMTGGGPINRTTTIVQLIYMTAFSDFNFGKASAQALILFAIIWKAPADGYAKADKLLEQVKADYEAQGK